MNAQFQHQVCAECLNTAIGTGRIDSYLLRQIPEHLRRNIRTCECCGRCSVICVSMKCTEDHLKDLRELVLPSGMPPGTPAHIVAYVRDRDTNARVRAECEAMSPFWFNARELPNEAPQDTDRPHIKFVASYTFFWPEFDPKKLDFLSCTVLQHFRRWFAQAPPVYHLIEVNLWTSAKACAATSEFFMRSPQGLGGHLNRLMINGCWKFIYSEIHFSVGPIAPGSAQ